jgi:hypothetical protein
MPFDFHVFHDLVTYQCYQGVSYPGFYNDDNFERAYKFLEWMADRIHTNPNYFNVGTLQVMNEPVHAGEYPSEAGNLVWNFYPNAWKRIRDAEKKLGTADSNLLHIQFMVCYMS